MEYDINWCFSTVKTYINQLQEEEKNSYFLASLKRILITIDAAKLLNDKGFDLDTSVSLRVAIEHAARINYFKKNPEKMTAEVSKVFGKGPRVKDTLLVLNGTYEQVYELVSAFSHPDALSLIMSLDNNQDGRKELSSLIIKSVLVFLLNILIVAYPEVKKPVTEEVFNELGNSLLKLVIELFCIFGSKIDELNLQVDPEIFSNIFAQKSKIGGPIIDFVSTLDDQITFDESTIEYIINELAKEGK
ncbi:hypothetical protein [Brevibacillus sp. SYSU BS000544]|uniref:hypothetical protein n=1 Tax=Brevibacillus sp. SYSU BS000544 TaxID=3416443 RepID=UPI003CE55E1D